MVQSRSLIDENGKRSDGRIIDELRADKDQCWNYKECRWFCAYRIREKQDYCSRLWSEGSSSKAYGIV